MWRLAFFAFLILPFGLSGQGIQVKQDSAITRLFDHFVATNKEKNHQEGWRIQILSTTDRQRMESMRQAFLYRFPSIPVNWVHQPPYYKLRAGAFATRLDAVHLLHLVQTEFPTAYLAKDNFIKPEELLEVY